MHLRDAYLQVQEMEIQQYIHRKDSKINERVPQPIESKCNEKRLAFIRYAGRKN